MNSLTGFDAREHSERLVNWISEWFACNSNKDSVAVIGISGGKDSAVAAAACVKALGKHRVVGVIMPNITQADIDDSLKVTKSLDIVHYIVPVTMASADILNQVEGSGVELKADTYIKVPSHIRLATLYSAAASMNGFVVNTANLTKTMLGIHEKHANSYGDIAPLLHLTNTEVIQIGNVLNVPQNILNKKSSSGLTALGYEEELGVRFKDVDEYIRHCKVTGSVRSARLLLYQYVSKQNNIPHYIPGLPIFAKEGG